MTEYSELEKELRKASDEGDADASYRLAVLMRDGAEGIPRRPFESSMFFRKASDMNHVNATVLLGLMYLEGLGVWQIPEGPRISSSRPRTSVTTSPPARWASSTRRGSRCR